MAALLIGGNNSYVGEAKVGGAAFIYTSSGSLAFTGLVFPSVHVNFTAAGLLAFTGHAPLEVKRPSTSGITFSGQLGKHYTRTYGGFLAFSGAASGSFSGSISVRSSSGGITFEGNGQGFKSKEYFTNLTDSYEVGVSSIGVLQVGAAKSVNSIIFTGTVLKQAQSTKIATGVLELNVASALVSRHRVVVATPGLLFTGAASYQRTVRSNIWEVKDAYIDGVNEGGSSIWEADALIDAATAPALPAVITSTNGGSDNIWGTA